MSILREVRVPTADQVRAECAAVDQRVTAQLDAVQNQIAALLVLYCPPKNRRVTDKQST